MTPAVYTISGNDLYVVCYGASSNAPYIARVDLTTNAVSAYETTYQGANFTYVNHIAVDGGALWYDGTLGSACIAPCRGFLYTVRVDLASGKSTLALADTGLRGDGFGYIWTSITSGQLSKLDPATGTVAGTIPFKYDTLQLACGSMWGFVTPTFTHQSTTVSRIDPASGVVLASFEEQGFVGELQQIGSECWAPAYNGELPGLAAWSSQSPAPNHFDRIDQSSISFRTPGIPAFTIPSVPGQGSATLFDGTFWLTGTDVTQPDHPLATMQRIDPATWKTAGPIWTYPSLSPAFAAGGNLWANEQVPSEVAPPLIRLDVSLDPLGG
jgi:hypothetical protein